MNLISTWIDYVLINRKTFSELFPINETELSENHKIRDRL